MNAQIKTGLLTTALFFLLQIGLQAQDKYKYAVITLTPQYHTMEISINGETYQKIKVPDEKIKGLCDVNPALEEINKMTEDDWELFDTGTSNTGTNNGVYVYVFYLRKKK